MEWCGGSVESSKPVTSYFFDAANTGAAASNNKAKPAMRVHDFEPPYLEMQNLEMRDLEIKNLEM